ncbi:MAG: ribonuclease HII [Proteobacteria bacterium]|nr:ribonuclease HII [Pseudomonadota bacterium]MBU1611322.1 ribonuclease HII [Pseudomonadota bacterium]
MPPTLIDLDSIPAPETAGIDEAGRGCLAGPVVAGAVILPDDSVIDGLTDSKLLTAEERDALVDPIKDVAVAWSVGVAWPWEVDEINILQATFLAMSRAVFTLRTPVRMLYVDGDKVIPKQVIGEGYLQRAVIGGDAKVPAISAASILAKTWRDHLMLVLSRRYPGYGFEGHKGYGTKAHLETIRQFGPCRMHRMTFKGVRPEEKSKESQGWLLDT